MKVNKIVLIISAVAVILLIAASVLLFQSISQFRDVSGQLNLSRQQLSDLYRRNPFPSDANIATELDNLDVLHQEWSALLTELAEGQVEPVQTSPTRFLEMFRDTTRNLVEAAERRGVAIPVDAAFGFQRHRSGQLPASADVPRLIQQLTIIEQLTQVLYEVRVEKINAITRQEFEAPDVSETTRPASGGGGLWGATATPRRPERDTPTLRDRDVGIIEPGADYASLRFSLDVTLRENNLRELLNALANHDMFIVVTHVEIDNSFTWQPAAALRKAREAASDDPAASGDAINLERSDEPLPRSARVVTGMQSPFRVKIDLEVYRFRKDEAS